MVHQASGPVSTYRQFCAAESPRQRIRARVRDSAITLLSVKQSVPRSNWIRFPYYHHVFDDQRDGFTAQLRWMKNLGTVISLDDAMAVLEDDGPIDGRYFCVTFDDGYKNCITNALPILAEHEVPAAFFIPTAFVGAGGGARNPALRGRIGAYDLALTEFLSWEDCRALVAAGMTIGSHSVSHPRLIDLPDHEAENELRASKQTIEHHVGVDCRDFASPKGRPDVDFVTHRDPAIAKAVGYRSFLTTRRASVQQRPSPMLVPRDHLIASWSVHQLRYFFSR